MMNIVRNSRTKWLMAGVIASLLILVGCAGGAGGGNNDDGSARSYMGTQNPGDYWNWSFDADGPGSFSATNITLGHDYSGTYVEAASGFLELTITSATSQDGTPPVTPLTATALEIPNTALIVLPPDGGSPIMAIAQGDCPAEGMVNFNYVAVPDINWTANNSSAYSMAEVTVLANGQVSGSGSDYLLNLDPTATDPAPASFASFTFPDDPTTHVTSTAMTCVNGEITSADPDNEMVIGFTSSGLFFGDFGPNVGGLIGVEAPTANIDLSALTDQSSTIEFRGMYNDANGAKLVWGVPTNVQGSILVGDDPVPGNNELASLAFEQQVEPGIVSGRITPIMGGNSNALAMIIGQINGKYYIFGIGVDVATQTEPYNFVLMEM